MRKFVGAALVATSVSFSCLPVMVEPLRVNNIDSITAVRLGFVRGKTTFLQAERLMKAQGLTGISKDSFIDGGPARDAITADYQDKIHLFESNKYRESIEVEGAEMLPYSYGLRFARHGKNLFLMALFRDALDMTEQHERAKAPRIEFFRMKNGSFVHSHNYFMKNLSEKMGGLTDPVFVGHSLDDGVLFLARDSEGRVWDSAFHIRLRKGRTLFSSVPLSEAARCSCIQNYLYGLDPLSITGTE